MKPMNITEAKILAERYETITIEEIEGAWGTQSEGRVNPRQELTGFGHPETCTLCLVVKEIGYDNGCMDCIYEVPYGCIDKDTWQLVSKANTPRRLLKAFRKRANHIRETLKQWEE